MSFLIIRACGIFEFNDLEHENICSVHKGNERGVWVGQKEEKRQQIELTCFL